MSAGAFDFWLGTWEGTWDGGAGTNVVTREYEGRVILERFAARDGFHGMSVSVFDVRAGCWKQTWVDSEGNYLDFAGGPADGTIDLRRAAGGSTFRMLWHDLEPDRFAWKWQRAEHEGAWETLWGIDYVRVA
jgi:hypothetical protein